MRWVLFGAAAVTLAAMAEVRPAAAQEYPWCAYYSRGDVGNCGFRSLAQCRATISSIGGYCQQNPRYQAQRPVYREAPRRAAPRAAQPRRSHR